MRHYNGLDRINHKLKIAATPILKYLQASNSSSEDHYKNNGSSYIILFGNFQIHKPKATI